MSLYAISVDVAPDPWAIARALASRPGLAMLHSGDGSGAWGGASYVAVGPVETSSALVPGGGPSGFDPDDRRALVPRWIGVLAFEAGRGIERPGWTRSPDHRPAPHVEAHRWHRYAAVVEIDHARGRVQVVGDDRAAVAELARAVARPTGGALPVRSRAMPDEEPASAHVERVRAAKQLIAAGDLYQVNLARRIRLALAGRPIDLYARLAAASPPRFGACLDLGDVSVLSTSPELFLACDRAGRVLTAPIKGTRPRGRDAGEDAALARELDLDPKERAELAMIVDVERNDLGRVAETGSVRLLAPPHVESHRTVHHRVALVSARLRAGVSPEQLVLATFPSGSVTGAPKVRAMEVIAKLEPVRRGLYTGALGSVAWDGSLRLAMAIRVLTVREGEGHYYAGGGIVADSDPDRELAETRWKAVQALALS